MGENDHTDENNETLILGKFKSADDLAKAYGELEPEFTRTRQELSDLKRQLQEIQEQKAQLEQQSAHLPVSGEDDEDEDLDNLFFRQPTKAMERFMQPVFETKYITEKAVFETDPAFKKLEPEIDMIVAKMPDLKKQPGIVGQLFKMVKGLHLDEILHEHEEKIRGEIAQGKANKMMGALEDGSPPLEKHSQEDEDAQLTEQEKKVAAKFHPELAPDEAYKKYAVNKKKFGSR